MKPHPTDCKQLYCTVLYCTVNLVIYPCLNCNSNLMKHEQNRRTQDDVKNNVKSLLTLLHRDERPLETIINVRYITSYNLQLTSYNLQPTSPVPGLCLKSRNLILPSFQQDHTLTNINFHHLLLQCFWLPTNLILILYDFDRQIMKISFILT